MTGKRIFLIEDDTTIGRILRDNLEYDGFSVEWSQTGNDAIEVARHFKPDLVLLDLTLPDGPDGFELCEHFSQGPDRTHVIIITAHGNKDEHIRGLTLGADDYVVKPFALEILLARIHAVLRRTNPHLERVSLGDVIIDFQRLRVSKGHQEIAMTDREFEVLRYLAERSGSIVTRAELLRLVWGYVEKTPTRTVDSFIFRLRHKLEPDPRHPRYIRTAHGDGYRFTPHE